MQKQMSLHFLLHNKIPENHILIIIISVVDFSFINNLLKDSFVKTLDDLQRNGINPEDELPDKSLLSKFRTSRLQESTLDDIITEIVRQCVVKGIINNKDSYEWQCSQGNITVTKKFFKIKEKSRTDREGYKYYFELKQCKDCPKHSECAKTSARKILQVGLNTAEFY